jgi:RNA polymerase sigma-70 factor (ECF subfamily)
MIAAMSPPSPGADLIAKIASGSQEAMTQLYDQTANLVYGMASRIVRDGAVAEEVAMDVYLQVWRTARQYSAARGSVKAWLATMTRARAIDWLRSSQARLVREGSRIDELAPLAVAGPGPEQAAMDSGRQQALRKHMGALPPEQSRLIEMSFFSGFSHSEIAERLGIPLGTVKSRLRQGMCRLRECFQTEAWGMN